MAGSPLLTSAAIASATAAGLAFSAFSDGYTPFVVALVALTTITGVGLNVLLGLSGQVSFGHVGFYAIGAYSVGVLTLKGVGFWLALLFAAGLAGAVGVLLALPALRVTGPYLAMMTIAFGFFVEHGAIEWRDVTGGQNGLAGLPQPALGAWLEGERALAAIAVALAGASLFAFQVLARGVWGLSMIAVRESETAASGIGLRPTTVKTLSFTLSAIFTGIAGGCFAALLAFVAPSAFPFSQSILFLLAVVVGGAGWTLGPLVGAVVTVVLPELISSLAEYRLLIFGALLLVVLWLAPGGVIGTLAARLTRPSARKGAATGIDLVPFLGERAKSTVLEVKGLSIAFGGIRAVSDVDLTIAPSEVTGLIGPNGAGKTTVLNMVSGFYKPDAGSIRLGDLELAGRPSSDIARAGIARTYQTTQLFASMSVLENVVLGLRVGRLGSPVSRLEDPASVAIAEGLLAFVGYAGDVDAPASRLAHVDRRLVEIARAVATRPSVLLLDEPAAGLSAEDKQHLGKVLRKLADAGMAVVLVEHDMGLVMGVCDAIFVLDSGKRIAAGPPAAIRSDAAVREAYLGSGEMRARRRSGTIAATAPVVLEVESLQAGYGALPVLRGVSFDIRQGELVTLLGANGAGKSTTMRAVSGLLRPACGKVSLSGRDIASASAHHIAGYGLALVPEGRQVFRELTVRENLMLGAYVRGGADIEAEIAEKLRRFPRLAERIDVQAGLLSGGEAQMLAIARGQMSKPRIMLLDEPSLGLAPAIVEEVYEVMSELRDAGVTLLVVDQMAAMALKIADRGYVISSGQIVHAGTADELSGDPALEGAYLGHAAPAGK